MLVEYTPIASLSQGELSALKNATTGLRLEGRGSHFVFMGKTFAMHELLAQQRVWENDRKTPGTQLNG